MVIYGVNAQGRAYILDNFFLYLQFQEIPHTASVAVLYRYLLDKAVHTRIFRPVACSCVGKDTQKLLTDVHLVDLMWNYPLFGCKFLQLEHKI